MPTLEVRVMDLLAGDKVVSKGRLVYTIEEILQDDEVEFIARIQWADGGFDIRVWGPEHYEQKIDVVRA